MKSTTPTQVDTTLLLAGRQLPPTMKHFRFPWHGRRGTYKGHRMQPPVPPLPLHPWEREEPGRLPTLASEQTCL